MITVNLQTIVDAHKKQSEDASNMFKEFKSDLEGSFKVLRIILTNYRLCRKGDKEYNSSNKF